MMLPLLFGALFLIVLAALFLFLSVRYQNRHPLSATEAVIDMVDSVIQAAEDLFAVLLSVITLILNLIDVLIREGLKVGEAVANDIVIVSDATFSGVETVAGSLEPLGQKLKDGTIQVAKDGIQGAVDSFDKVAGGLNSIGDSVVTACATVAAPLNFLNPFPKG
jgi:hypothetical protein